MARHLAHDFNEFKALYGLEGDPALVEPSWAHILIDALNSPGMSWLLLLIGGAALVCRVAKPGHRAGGLDLGAVLPAVFLDRLSGRHGRLARSAVCLWPASCACCWRCSCCRAWAYLGWPADAGDRLAGAGQPDVRPAAQRVPDGAAAQFAAVADHRRRRRGGAGGADQPLPAARADVQSDDAGPPYARGIVCDPRSARRWPVSSICWDARG